jgi:hypothetical protein
MEILKRLVNGIYLSNYNSSTVKRNRKSSRQFQKGNGLFSEKDFKGHSHEIMHFI